MKSRIPWALPVALALVLCAGAASAERLPAGVTPSHYDLAFAVDLAGARFDGTETIHVALAQPTRTIVLHAVELTFHEVTIGRGASAQHATVALDETANTATFTVPNAIAKGTTEIHVRYSGILNDKLRGFYLSHGTNRNYAVTQFESTDARRAFPAFDEPALKATFSVTLTIPKGDIAISNGHVIADTPGPTPAQHVVKFSETPRMSTYLVAMAVGDFACTAGAADGIPIRICATPDKKDLLAIALESAEHILAFYDRYYAIKYPFGKLDVLAVPDFAAGAMENTAAIFYRETDLLAETSGASVSTRKNIASVLAHEMAHQWFGDLVTMKWWDDIWLNEGFATWMANRPLDDWKAEWNIPVDEALENQAALGLDSLQNTRPIHSAVSTPTEIDEAFDVIAYEKGAAVLRMIESYVGREVFRKGVNAYLAAHAYGNAESADFWNAIAAASGKPVDKIMPTFVNQPGVPLLDVTTSCDGTTTRLTVAQQRFFVSTEAGAASAARWQVPWCVKTATAATPRCDVLAEATQTIPLQGNSCAPWVFANAGAQGYFRTAYPPAMLRALAPNVEKALTAPERLTLIDDEWALMRAGRHTAADYLTLSTGFGTEHASGVLGEVVGRLGFIHEYLTTDASRPALEAFVRSLFTPLLAEVGFAPASSDTDERRELRALAVNALGTAGNDHDTIAQSSAAVLRVLEGGPAIEPTLAGAMVTIAAAHGDAALYEALVAAAAKASSPEDRYRYLNAVAAFHDKAVLTRALDRALTSEIRNQDTALYLSRFLRYPIARPLAWSFIKAHWVELQPKISIVGGDAIVVSGLGAFCDAGMRDDVKAFFAEHPAPGAVRALNQAVERINNCSDLREKQTSVVGDWLKSR